MNKNILRNLIALALVVSVATAAISCKKNANETSGSVVAGITTNEPVASTTLRSEPEEATFEQMMSEYGVDLSVPSTATDVHYGVATLADGRVVGQVDYKIDGFQVHLRGYNYGDIDINTLSPSDLENLVNLSELTNTFNATGGGFESLHVNGSGSTVSGSYNTSYDGFGRLDFFYRDGTTVYSLWVDFGSTAISMPALYSGYIVLADSET